MEEDRQSCSRQMDQNQPDWAFEVVMIFEHRSTIERAAVVASLMIAA